MDKTLRIGIITAYPEEDWHSRELIEAAASRGEVRVIRPEQLGARVTDQGVSILAEGMELDPIDGFVLARGFGDRGNADFMVPVYQILERSGKVMVNSIEAVLTAIDKFETSCRLQQVGIPTPPVVVTQDARTAHAVLCEWKRAVMKPLFGSLGMGIEFVEDTCEGHALLPIALDRFGAIYIQAYIDTPGRDIRAFVIGPRVIASMYRVAAPGSRRANLAQGAHAEPCELDADTCRMAVAAARATGLDYTGVDILEGPAGPMVIEVNGNPLWRGLQEVTGLPVAEAIVSWVAERITQTSVKGGEYIA